MKKAITIIGALLILLIQLIAAGLVNLAPSKDYSKSKNTCQKDFSATNYTFDYAGNNFYSLSENNQFSNTLITVYKGKYKTNWISIQLHEDVFIKELTNILLKLAGVIKFFNNIDIIFPFHYFL